MFVGCLLIGKRTIRAVAAWSTNKQLNPSPNEDGFNCLFQPD